MPARVSPPDSTSAVPIGTSATPPTEMPVAEMLIALARRAMNQRLMMALTATFEDIPNPIANTVYRT
jgi:hypothetical protein